MFIRLTPFTDKRRRLGHPVHRSIFVGSPFRPSCLLLHALRITTYESDCVEPLTNTCAIQLLRECLIADVSCFVEAIESNQRFCQVSWPDSSVWIQSLRFSRCRHGFFILARD